MRCLRRRLPGPSRRASERARASAHFSASRSSLLALLFVDLPLRITPTSAAARARLSPNMSHAADLRRQRVQRKNHWAPVLALPPAAAHIAALATSLDSSIVIDTRLLNR